MTGAASLFAGRAALVTGASSGIGRAIALALAAEGTDLWLVGQNRDRLVAAADAAHRRGAPTAHTVAADLTCDAAVEALATSIHSLDILVHAAGVYARASVAEAGIADLDGQYRANLRAPYLLTQRLLPLLVPRGGEIVFVNSTQGLAASPEVSQFAATQHGLKAVADSLRAEVNPLGVRVLTLHVGRTGTPRQERIFAAEGRIYEPERLMQPEDVAAMVLAALKLPRSAEVTSIALRPMQKP